MREIKFRVWDKQTNNWQIAVDYQLIKRHSEDQNRYVIMQYAGLKDKHGKEIYEGDLLKCSDGTGKDWVTHIQFDEEMGCWHRFRDYQMGEVIGNIYETPQFLSKDCAIESA
jgi:hypothetical protein